VWGNKTEKKTERRIPEKYGSKAEKTRIFGDNTYNETPYTASLSIRKTCSIYAVASCWSSL
jgi:hypothetical protein